METSIFQNIFSEHKMMLNFFQSVYINNINRDCQFNGLNMILKCSYYIFYLSIPYIYLLIFMNKVQDIIFFITVYSSI